MIFCARQLIEKILEHKETMYITFVDLRKAYDSVPQEAMRKALQKYGLPPEVVRLVKSFHEYMSATLRIHGESLEGEIAVTGGLRQGCTMAPTLFNLFFNLVVEAWHWECREVVVTVLYSADGHLIGSRSKMEQTSWSELQFADDMAVVTTSREDDPCYADALRSDRSVGAHCQCTKD